MAKFGKVPPDPRGGHIRLYWELIDSNAWRCLSSSDQRVYVALLRELRKTNNGDLALSLKMAKFHGIKSQTTLAKSLLALASAGLIAVTREGGCKPGGQRLPTLYRITDQQVFEMPAKHIEACKATNDWRAVTTLAHGRNLIKEAEKAAKGEWARKQAEKQSEKTKSLVQILGHTSPRNGVVEPITNPKIGPWPSRPVQKLDLAKKSKSPAEQVTVRVST